jgi:hypothetical protein
MYQPSDLGTESYLFLKRAVDLLMLYTIHKIDKYPPVDKIDLQANSLTLTKPVCLIKKQRSLSTTRIQNRLELERVKRFSWSRTISVGPH